MRKKRKIIQNELSELEGIEETSGLSPSQFAKKADLLTENLNLMLDEESYWHNRSHQNWLHKGDLNTSFFHKCANGKRRKTKIISFGKDGIEIEGEQQLMEHATDYYRNLFGPEPGNDFRLDPEIWEGCAKLDVEDNNILCLPFSESEIKGALFQMERNKAPGPDKIPIEFYQCCWDIVKKDIIDLFDNFHDGKADISRLNYGTITLLPKIKDAAKIQ